MTDTLAIAQQSLLSSSDIDLGQLQRVLTSLWKPGVNIADIYLQNTYQETWGIEDQLLKSGSFEIDRGLSVRVVMGEKTGFAYNDSIDLESLHNSAAMASQIIDSKQAGKACQLQGKAIANPLYSEQNPLKAFNDRKKIDLLKQIDRVARAQDKRVIRVNAQLSASYDIVAIANLTGLWIADVRPLVSVHVTVIAEDKGRIERGFSGCGARADYQYLIDENRGINCAERAVRQALLNLEAIAAPAGVMPVILGPGWPGVLLHEAIGHGLEGDFNRKGSSAFSGRIGQHVATSACTIVDDGQLDGRRGSLSIDDEGTVTQRTVLVENGILKAYMHDRLNADLMNHIPTGNGRRESYACLPMPRMTNTFMLPGQCTQEEIIASVDRGLYVADMSGGQVDITSGQFVFSTSEAYLVEKGRIIHPVKDATLIGHGPDVLTKIALVGNDLQLDLGIGVCGKDGQMVPVGVGQPSLLIKELVVGGTQLN